MIGKAAAWSSIETGVDLSKAREGDFVFFRSGGKARIRKIKPSTAFSYDLAFAGSGNGLDIHVRKNGLAGTIGCPCHDDIVAVEKNEWSVPELSDA